MTGQVPWVASQDGQEEERTVRSDGCTGWVWCDPRPLCSIGRTPRLSTGEWADVWVGGWMCAVSVISACSSLKHVYHIATVATITEKNVIIFLVFKRRYLGSKSICITPLPHTHHTHTHTTHTHHTHTHTHTHTPPTHSCSWTLATAWSTRTGRTRSRWIGPMLWIRISVSAISWCTRLVEHSPENWHTWPSSSLCKWRAFN